MPKSYGPAAHISGGSLIWVQIGLHVWAPITLHVGFPCGLHRRLLVGLLTVYTSSLETSSNDILDRFLVVLLPDIVQADHLLGPLDNLLDIDTRFDQEFHGVCQFVVFFDQGHSSVLVEWRLHNLIALGLVLTGSWRLAIHVAGIRIVLRSHLIGHL